MSTVIRIQSDDKESIDLFFELLGKGIVAKGSDSESFEGGGVHTAIFKLDFKGLQKAVTIKKKRKTKNVTKPQKRPLKQDNKKNVKLTGVVGLYRSRGMSYQKIADKMNDDGYTNSRGLAICKQQVYRLYEKYKKEEIKLLKK